MLPPRPAGLPAQHTCKKAPISDDLSRFDDADEDEQGDGGAEAVSAMNTLATASLARYSKGPGGGQRVAVAIKSEEPMVSSSGAASPPDATPAAKPAAAGFTSPTSTEAKPSAPKSLIDNIPSPPKVEVEASTSNIVSEDEKGTVDNNNNNNNDNNNNTTTAAAASSADTEMFTAPTVHNDTAEELFSDLSDTEEDRHILKDIRKPGPHDVLFGRGGLTNRHTGNVNFRSLLQKHKMRYINAWKADKPKVAREVVAVWRSMDPPGRFLAPTKSEPHSNPARGIKVLVWHDVGKKRAQEKTSQCLREKTSQIKAAEAMASLHTKAHAMRARQDHIDVAREAQAVNASVNAAAVASGVGVGVGVASPPPPGGPPPAHLLSHLPPHAQQQQQQLPNHHGPQAVPPLPNGGGGGGAPPPQPLPGSLPYGCRPPPPAGGFALPPGGAPVPPGVAPPPTAPAASSAAPHAHRPASRLPPPAPVPPPPPHPAHGVGAGASAGSSAPLPPEVQRILDLQDRIKAARGRITNAQGRMDAQSAAVLGMGGGGDGGAGAATATAVAAGTATAASTANLAALPPGFAAMFGGGGGGVAPPSLGPAVGAIPNEALSSFLQQQQHQQQQQQQVQAAVQGGQYNPALAFAHAQAQAQAQQALAQQHRNPQAANSRAQKGGPQDRPSDPDLLSQQAWAAYGAAAAVGGRRVAPPPDIHHPPPSFRVGGLQHQQQQQQQQQLRPPAQVGSLSYAPPNISANLSAAHRVVPPKTAVAANLATSGPEAFFTGLP